MKFVAVKGIALEYSEGIAPARGTSTGGKITLLPGQSLAEEFATLAHELAHEMMHRDERRKNTSKRSRETEAEAVAFVVCQAIGLETSVHYRPESDSGGPSWLTFLGHMKDSLWSSDLFRCESATLRTHWVLVVMDQFTRRIVGFAVPGAASLMGWPCARCSIERFEGKQRRTI